MLMVLIEFYCYGGWVCFGLFRNVAKVCFPFFFFLYSLRVCVCLCVFDVFQGKQEGFVNILCFFFCLLLLLWRAYLNLMSSLVYIYIFLMVCKLFFFLISFFYSNPYGVAQIK